MTAGATEENTDLGWEAAWTHSTSWNVTAISTNRAWYRYTPGATWRRVSGVLSVIVGHSLSFPTASISFPHSLQIPGKLFSLPFSLSYFLSPSIHAHLAVSSLSMTHTKNTFAIKLHIFLAHSYFDTLRFRLLSDLQTCSSPRFVTDFSKISCFFLMFLNVWMWCFYHNVSVFLLTLTNFSDRSVFYQKEHKKENAE